MKKVFPLRLPGRQDARVLEAVKHDVRKYVNRERRKPLPEGFQLWEFDCRVGPAAASATPAPLKDLGRAVDAVAATGGESVYIEILARAAVRTPRSAASADAAPL